MAPDNEAANPIFYNDRGVIPFAPGNQGFFRDDGQGQWSRFAGVHANEFAQDPKSYAPRHGDAFVGQVDPTAQLYSRDPNLVMQQRGQWVKVGQQSSGANEGGFDRTVGEYRFIAAPEAPAAPAPSRQTENGPPPPAYNIFDYSPQGWDDYTNIARRETLGMNRMPFVGPNGAERGMGYQDIPYDPLLSLEMFYPGTSNQWRDKLRDPLEGALLKPIVS